MKRKNYTEEDTTDGRIDHMIEHRVPWIFLGLLGGLFVTFIVSKYEAILSADLRLAFFIPIIVYLGEAVGNQTETIYVRALSENKKINFVKYILKESAAGFGLGAVTGMLAGIYTAYWLSSYAIGITVGLALLINLTLAPVLAVLIPNVLYRRHSDPALGSGPVATSVQDLISILVYFILASLIIL